MAGKYPNSGSLFKNDRKEQPNHADYNGSAEVDGVDYWINAWVKEGNNKKFLSISFKPKAPKATSEPQEDGTAEAVDFF